MRRFLWLILVSVGICALVWGETPAAREEVPGKREYDEAVKLEYEARGASQCDTCATPTGLPRRALMLYREAAEKGYAPAQNYLGYQLFLDGHPGEGLDWLLKAAGNGSATAAVNLGWLLINGPGIEHNTEDALYWLHKGADAGQTQALLFLSEIYTDGKLVSPDTLRADSLLHRAIDLGAKERGYRALMALHMDSLMALPGDALVREAVKMVADGAPIAARPLVERGAYKFDNARAWTLLGDMLSRPASGLASDYDHDGAVRAYLRGALGGDPSAQFVVAELLEIFPDALDVADVEVPEEGLRNPQYWYDLARLGGVENAEQATVRLYSVESEEVAP